MHPCLWESGLATRPVREQKQEADSPSRSPGTRCVVSGGSSRDALHTFLWGDPAAPAAGRAAGRPLTLHL